MDTQQLSNIRKITLTAASLFLYLSALFGQPGTLDPTFTTYDDGSGDGLNGYVLTSALQADGKLLLGGNFTEYNCTSQNYITRLNLDGTLDNDFNIGSGADYNVHCIHVQNDAKILVGGHFDSFNGEQVGNITRLNPDGSFDSSFDTGDGANGIVYAVITQSDGKILIGGNFTTYDQIARQGIARLNQDGSLDTSFDPGQGATESGSNIWTDAIAEIAIQSDGKIIVVGHFTEFDGVSRNKLARLNSDGSLDLSLNPGTSVGFDNSSLAAVAIQSDGKILIGGSFTDYNGNLIQNIVRVNSDGSYDSTFNVDIAFSGKVMDIDVLASQQLLIAGYFENVNGIPIDNVARLNADGSVDQTFSHGEIGGSSDGVRTISVNSDGNLYIAGHFTSIDGNYRFRVGRLESNGQFDPTFMTRTGLNYSVAQIGIQQSGKIIVGGSLTTLDQTEINHLVRLDANGNFDLSFQVGTGFNYPIIDLIVQPDDKVVACGSFTEFDGVPANNIARLNANGSFDTTFQVGVGPNGSILAMALQPDEKIVITGWFTEYDGSTANGIARLEANGSLDQTFEAGLGLSGGRKLAIQPDGKIIVVGDFTEYDGVSRARIVRLNSNGAIDLSFDPGAGAEVPPAPPPSPLSSISDIVLLPNGQMVIVGYLDTYDGISQNGIARINVDGTLDQTFNNGYGANSRITFIEQQIDGKLLIGGSYFLYDSIPTPGFTRLLNDGSIDATFDVGTGVNGSLNAVAIQPDSKILIGGDFNCYNGFGKNRIARLLNDGMFVSTENMNSELAETSRPSIYYSDGAIHVIFNEAVSTDVMLYDLHGRLLIRETVNAEQYAIPISISTGIYLVNIDNSNANISKKLFVY